MSKLSDQDKQVAEAGLEAFRDVYLKWVEANEELDEARSVLRSLDVFHPLWRAAHEKYVDTKKGYANAAALIHKAGWEWEQQQKTKEE